MAHHIRGGKLGGHWWCDWGSTRVDVFFSNPAWLLHHHDRLDRSFARPVGGFATVVLIIGVLIEGIVIVGGVAMLIAVLRLLHLVFLGVVHLQLSHDISLIGWKRVHLWSERLDAVQDIPEPLQLLGAFMIFEAFGQPICLFEGLP